ncbi:hypothetical protein J4H86_04170 [Spiractinospora alimapuensis]|uniref:hypothetical protein n=1 Tax=Spiractinospora alimapuensis TaxID=2820884 RepID=UPI001F2A3D5D|nr:hypothetical protein [Spiractinospora alimapuensis]QVQ53011.1 hypothetical protein J4H86_04170 [Spiractinospora alimapuensis]
MAPDPATPSPRDADGDAPRTLAGSGRRPRTIVPRSAPSGSDQAPPSPDSGSTADAASATPAAPAAPASDEPWSGFSAQEREGLRGRWRQLQGDFVDDPNAAVRDADALVAETLRTLQQRLSDHHASLEARWTTNDADTEQLRHTIRRYRAFLNTMLAAGD